MSDARKPPADWSALLRNAVAKPGVISKAYNIFWRYSTANQLLALFECLLRGIEPGPIHTFHGWRQLGRQVRKGEKAITLCMPVSIRRKKDASGDPPPDATASPDGRKATFTRFLYKPHWFVLSQTEGEAFKPAALPDWNEAHALAELEIDRIAFQHGDGNCQGYAMKRSVAVSPIAFAPYRTLFHELAHVLLGHTEELERMDDPDQTPRNLREVEAESVALICCESLGLDLAEYSRGYIQHWLQGETIPEKSAHRIFKAADQILKAGHPPIVA
jgi:antirestriction protein ArdC